MNYSDVLNQYSDQGWSDESKLDLLLTFLDNNLSASPAQFNDHLVSVVQIENEETLGIDDVINNLTETLSGSSAENIADAYKEIVGGNIEPLSNETYRRTPDGTVLDGDDVLKSISDVLENEPDGNWIAQKYNQYSSDVIQYIGDSMFERKVS